MNQIQDFLHQYLKTFPYLEGLIISDKEGIEIFSAYREEKSLLKENQATTMFVAGLNQSNENLAKLNQTKINSLTLFYENYVVFLEAGNGFFLTIFSKIDANISLVKQIAGDILVSFGPLSGELDKINNLNKF